MELLAECFQVYQKKLVSAGLKTRFSIVLLLSATYAVSGNCPPCSEEDMDTTKSVCQKQGVYLQDSENTKNSTVVCLALHDLFICIAENIPQCLENVGSEYERYTWTPWHCSIDQHIKQYQEIVHNGCKQTKATYKPVKQGNQSSYKLANQNDTGTGMSLHKRNIYFSLTAWASLVFSIYPAAL